MSMLVPSLWNGRFDGLEGILGADSKGRKAKDRLWSPLFVLIIISALCFFMVGQGLNSGTSVYLETWGMSSAFTGILAAVFSAAAGIARLVCGPLIDSFGRIVVMVIGSLLLVAGTIMPVIVSGAVPFTICRILQGIGFSVATTAAATAAADVLPASRVGEGIGYFGLGQALAMSVGPALAIFLVGTEPPENLYLGLSAITVLGVVLTFLCRYEKNPRRLPETAEYRVIWEAERRASGEAEVAAGEIEAAAVKTGGAAADRVGADGARRDESGVEEDPPRGLAALLGGKFDLRAALPGMLPMLVLSPAFGFAIFFIGVYGSRIGVEGSGLFFTTSAIAMVAVRVSSMWFMDRIDPKVLATCASLCGIVAFAMLLFNDGDATAFYLAGIPYGLCAGVGTPLNQSIVIKNTSPDRWGSANAVFLLAVDIGIGISSTIWGFVNDNAGFSVTIICVMCCIAVSLLISYIVYPRKHS